MNVFKKFRAIMVVLIAAGALGIAGAASAGTRVGVSVSGTRAVVVDSGAEHVCTYEQRPVTRRYTDASGGSYEHRTYETVRVCTHAPGYYPEVASTKVYVETRPKARKERRKKRHTSYSVGVGYYGLHGSYGASTHYGPYPSHHYGYYGHHGYSRYGHHSPYSSISLSYGHGGSHHGYGHHGYGHYGHH